MSPRRRNGMALVATIAVVSLIAILGVATLSLSTRLRQGSTLSMRDARLSAAVAYGLGSVMEEWRARSLGTMTLGTTARFEVQVPGVAVGVSVEVTRLDAGVFWAVAAARAVDGSTRRENLVLRIRLPSRQSLLDDSSNVRSLGDVDVDSLAATADTTLVAGSIWVVGDGVIHAAGDLTIAGGSGHGILIVEGRLMITGAFSFGGVIVARQGIEVIVPGAVVTGIVRTTGEPWLPPGLGYSTSADTAQVVMANALMPRPVRGRRFSEMY